MATSFPSALVTDRGQRIKLRLGGRFFDVGQSELRTVLGIPDGPAGLGITIEGNRFHFEFAADRREVKINAALLHRRLAKLVGTSR